MTIYTSSEGSAGSRVSVHRLLLLSALTVRQNLSMGHTWSSTSNRTAASSGTNDIITFASSSLSGTLSLKQISVGVINQALENISYLQHKMVLPDQGFTFLQIRLPSKRLICERHWGGLSMQISQRKQRTSKYRYFHRLTSSIPGNSNTEIALMLIR